MFWQSKPTIETDDQEWQLQTWQWLLENFGGVEAMHSYAQAAPHASQFPDSGQTGKGHADFVFRQVVGRFRLEAENFRLDMQDAEIQPVVGPMAVVQNAPVNPLGTYQSFAEPGAHVITYSPSLLNDLEALIATFAHEICHPLLLTISDAPPGGPDMEEFTTDLAMVFFGFGIFGANGAFKFSQYTDTSTGTQGWGYTKAGYLTQPEWGFALAVRTLLADESEKIPDHFLSDGPRAHFRKNLKFLRNNLDLLDSLRL